ncbi:MAG: cobalamin biosynthesis protein [Roseburia sp.]|nr:cobalamin biosynthesis protein [Roseburia sp.]
MRLSIISFTESGKRLSERIAGVLERAADMEVRTALFTKCGACKNDMNVTYISEPVGTWAGAQLRERNALLFIGACGIAVRAIAPFLTDKLRDAPVLVMDETGRYVIPILSGHMGGANALALYLAQQTGAEPVITTATDIRGRFAVDLFAKENHLHIVNKEGIAKVSAKALAGEELTLSIAPEYQHRIEAAAIPAGVRVAPYPPAGFVDVLITASVPATDAVNTVVGTHIASVVDAAIVLCPKDYIIGVGCKKGKTADALADFIAGRLETLGISVAQLAALASIEQKREEAGLAEWCRRAGVPFLTYTAEELRAVQGNFAESAFVAAQVGVGNVCERAALKACGADGTLIAPKYARDGMTIAVARRGGA